MSNITITPEQARVLAEETARLSTAFQAISATLYEIWKAAKFPEPAIEFTFEEEESHSG